MGFGENEALAEAWFEFWNEQKTVKNEKNNFFCENKNKNSFLSVLT
jgi:hypothetical protein